MSSTERKAFLQRRTSTAAERAAYRAARKAESVERNKADQAKINAAHAAWLADRSKNST